MNSDCEERRDFIQRTPTLYNESTFKKQVQIRAEQWIDSAQQIIDTTNQFGDPPPLQQILSGEKTAFVALVTQYAYRMYFPNMLRADAPLSTLEFEFLLRAVLLEVPDPLRFKLTELINRYTTQYPGRPWPASAPRWFEWKTGLLLLAPIRKISPPVGIDPNDLSREEIQGVLIHPNKVFVTVEEKEPTRAFE